MAILHFYGEKLSAALGISTELWGETSPVFCNELASVITIFSVLGLILYFPAPPRCSNLVLLMGFH